MISESTFITENRKKSVRFIAVFLAILTLITTLQMSRITSFAEENTSVQTDFSTDYDEESDTATADTQSKGTKGVLKSSGATAPNPSGGSSGGGTSSSNCLGDTYYNMYKDAENNNSSYIVAEKYNDNATVKLSDDGSTRVRKSVIPTDTENEFFVDLSIDVKEEITESQYKTFFSDHFGVRSTNSYSTINEYVEGRLRGSEKGFSKTFVAGYKSGTFTVINSKGETIADNMTFYWEDANNTTFYLLLEGSPEDKTGRSIIVGTHISKDGHNYVIWNLTEQSENLINTTIKKNVTPIPTLSKVIDKMGTYIQYDESFEVVGDFDKSEKPTFTNGNLNWIPKFKSNVQPTEEISNSSTSGNTTTNVTTKWYCNVAELVYKVKLNVTSEDFVSGFTDSNTYNVNESATLYYNYNDTDKNVVFPVPTVKGKLKTTNVTITKNVTGEGADQSKLFEFDWSSKKDSGKYGKFELNGSTSKSVTLENLYVGDILLLKEAEDSNYNVTIDGNYSIENDYFNIPITENLNITVTNTRKTAKVTINKQVNGTINKDTFPFTYSYSISGTNGNIGKNNIEISVPKDGSDFFEVPTGATVTLKETTSTDYYVDSVKIGNQSLEADNNGNYTFIVNSDTAVTVTNKPVVKNTTITVKKHVTGNMGDRDKEFNFTATITSNGQTTTKTFKLKDFDKYSNKFELEVPIGAELVIEETNSDDYTTTSKFGNTTGNSTITITTVQNSGTVEFTNEKKEDINTGITLDSVPYVISIIGVISLFAFMMIKRRRHAEN